MAHNLTDFHHATPIQLRFNDVDALGHVNNAVIQEYFDLGRLHYLRDSIGEQLKVDGKNLIIVSYKTDFYNQVLLSDNISVLTRVYKLGNKSLHMFQLLIKKNENTPLATCDSIMSGFNKASNSSMVLPDNWRKTFNLMEKGNLLQE